MNLLQVYLIRQTSLMALTLASFTSSTPSLVKTAGVGSEIAWSKYGKHRSWIFQRLANSCMDNAFNRGVDPNVCMVLRTGGIQNCSKKAWLYMNSIRPGSTVKEFDTISNLPVTYHTQQDLRTATPSKILNINSSLVSSLGMLYQIYRILWCPLFHLWYAILHSKPMLQTKPCLQSRRPSTIWTCFILILNYALYTLKFTLCCAMLGIAFMMLSLTSGLRRLFSW